VARKDGEMKITAFNGSPRAETSTTDVLVQALLRGARSAGAEVENVYLARQDVRYCRGCFSCWFRTPGVCTQRDGMEPLLRKFVQSDLVCLASPVYSWNMTANLKAFVDRLVPLSSPRTVQTYGGPGGATRTDRMPDVVVVANSGFPGPDNFDVLRHVFACAHPVAEIYRSCGPILKTTDPQLLPGVTAYLEAVETAGGELVRARRVSEETMAKLRVELVDAGEYMARLQGKVRQAE
jgi:NAD(P)H-dependent FMN reductase